MVKYLLLVLKRPVGLVCLILVLFVSCGAPFYYEQAKVNKGLTFGVGTGIGTGTTDVGGSIDEIDFCYYAAGLFTPYIRYGFSENVNLFLQASYGKGIGIRNWERKETEKLDWWFYDIQVGTKIRTGEHSALRLNVGLPTVLGITYLHDIKDIVTINSGLLIQGIGLVPTIGFDLHPKISENILSHISFNISGAIYPYIGNLFPLSASLGLGIDGTIFTKKNTF